MTSIDTESKSRSTSRSRSRSLEDTRSDGEVVKADEKPNEQKIEEKTTNIKSDTVVVLKRLTMNTNESHLREILSNYGVVKKVKIGRRDRSVISQGIGYVEMSSLDEAKLAIDYLDGSQIDGVKVNVCVAYRSPFELEVKKEKKVETLSKSSTQSRTRVSNRTRSHSRPHTHETKHSSHKRHESRESRHHHRDNNRSRSRSRSSRRR